MADLQTLYRFVLHLVSCLLVVGLVFMISLVLAYPCEAGKEEIVEAEDIIEALSLRDGDTGVIDYSGCIVEGDLDFSDLRKEKDKDVIIINRFLNFRKTVFHGRIGTWNQSMELEEQPPVKFLSTVDFVGASFEEDVNFDGAIFEENAYFDGAHFHKMASFTTATFNKSAGFRSTQFDERALFTKTVFEGRTDFTVATFNWLALFYKTEFRLPKSEAIFLFTRFNGLTYFTKAQFNSTARFTGTHFRGPTYFAECTFDDNAWFLSGCRFDDEVSFKDANFSKSGSYDYGENIGEGPPVLFSGVVFSGNAIFSDVQFNNVSFCEIGMEVDPGMDTIFRKKADFRRATFETLDLQRVIFESDVDFSNADFGERVDFSNVDIESASITLKWDQLCKKEGNEGWSYIERLLHDIWADFRYGDKKVPKFEWEGVNLSRQHGKYLVTDNQTCDAFVRFLSSLERNFKAHGQQKDAEKVHFLAEDTKGTRRWLQGTNRSMNMNGFKKILKKSPKYLNRAHINEGGHLLIKDGVNLLIKDGVNLIECCEGYICSCLDMLFFRYIYGYSVKFRRYVLASILAIFGFALVYMRRDVLWHDEREKGEIPGLLKINAMLRKGSDGKAVLKDSDRIIKRYMEGVWFSLSVFTKIGYRDVYVKDKYKKTSYAVKIEWFLAYILGALLLINLISRCEPLFRLVTTFI